VCARRVAFSATDPHPRNQPVTITLTNQSRCCPRVARTS
jgi:hypothetical protein